MGDGAAWNYIAMQQAIADSGLEETRRQERAHRPDHGLRRPFDPTIVAAADITREKGPKRVGPFAVPNAMSCTNSATLATPFGIKGVNYSISSACATSRPLHRQCRRADPVGQAGHHVRRRRRGARLDALGAVRRHGRDVDRTTTTTPEQASRAYDKNRDGFVIAGGAGIVVLEELEHAKARGAKIYGEIVGYGATSDGYDMVAPSGEGAARCMRLALATVKEHGRLHQPARHLDAGRRREGDRGDPRGVRRATCPPISATKSLTGHSLGATGVQEAIYCLLMMKNGFICESANIEELDPEFADMPIVRERIDNAELDIGDVQQLRLRRHQRARSCFQRYDGMSAT